MLHVQHARSTTSAAAVCSHPQLAHPSGVRFQPARARIRAQGVFEFEQAILVEQSVPGALKQGRVDEFQVTERFRDQS